MSFTGAERSSEDCLGAVFGNSSPARGSLRSPPQDRDSSLSRVRVVALTPRRHLIPSEFLRHPGSQRDPQ